tara:strand:+ start:166 stop:636 length:471 start_codon:yes stop_codon:yes gene_type:complete
MKDVAKIDVLIVSAFSVATLAILGIFYYTIYIAQKPLPKEKENLKKLKSLSKSEKMITGIPIKKILINLPSRTARLRFLELEVSLFPFSESQKDLIKKQLPILKDTIIQVASKMKPNELNSISGKILLEERIKRKFHDSIDNKVISKIYYTKFVVQ